MPEVNHGSAPSLVASAADAQPVRPRLLDLEQARAQLEIEHARAVAEGEAQIRAREEHYRAIMDRAEKEWLAAVLNSMNEEVYFTDTQRRYTYANPAAMREFGHSSVTGMDLHQIVGKLEVLRPDGSPRPIDEAPPLRALAGEVIRDEEQMVRIPRTGQLHHRQVSSAPVRDAAGAIIGSVSVVRDVTEQKKIYADLQARDARSTALVRLGDEFRSLTSTSDLAFAAARILGETIGVSRCGYGTIDVAQETITIERDWCVPAVASLAGVLRFRDYGTHIDELKRGATVVCEDIRTDPRTAATAAALEAFSVRSFVNMPVVELGGVVALLYLAHTRPRAWTADELAFIRDVAERTRLAVERRRSEQAVAQDLKDTRLLRDVAARLVGDEDASTLFDEILAAAMAITEADGGTIQLLDPDTSALTFAAIRGLDREMTSQLEHVQSTALVSRDGVSLGMLSTHWRRTRQLSERELRFLDLLARQAADLVERMRSLQKLRASEQRLRDADRLKDEFIAVLAHELRNPLVPIRTGVELLKGAREKPALVDDIRPMMERQLGHMVRLIDDLLDVSRIASGKIELRRQRVTLSSVVTSAVEPNRAAIAAGKLDLVLNLAEPARILEVDPTRFSQVLSNLVQNAAKFTPEGGTIAIRATIDTAASGAEELVIKVCDSGVGIPEHLLPRVFDLFMQAHPSEQGTRAGLGIGLALARRLIELHGGALTARSDGPGRGSEFTVRVPAPAGVEAEVSRQRAQRIAVAGLRVMVVDDNRDGCDAMGMLITELGADVQVAYDGASALSRLESHAPEVILLDIGMPEMDGYETCRQIRAKSGAAVTVVAVTGWGQEHDRQRAIQAGFDAHLTKPADPAEIAELISRVRRRT